MMISIAHRRNASSLISIVWELMRLRWRITWNGFRRSRTVRKIVVIIAVLAVIILAGVLFRGSWTVLDFLNSPELSGYIGDTELIVDSIPGVIFTGFFLGILLTSFGILLQALYLAGDIDFLLAMPVPIRAVFISKLLQAVLPNFGIGALFGWPVLFGLGFARGYNVLYFLLVVIMFVVVSLMAAGLAGLLVMLVVRIFPARRVAEVLGFVGAIFSILCSQSGNLMNSFSDEVNMANEQMSQAISLLPKLSTPWNPLNWPGKGLLFVGEGEWAAGLGLISLSLILTSGVFWFSLVTAERWYYTGWARMQTSERKKKVDHKPVVHSSWLMRLQPVVNNVLDTPVQAIIWKDSLMLRRDLRSFSQLITPLILGIVYSFIFLRDGDAPPAGRGDAPAWFMSLWSYANILLSIFVSWMLIQRLGGMGISSEGKNYWLIKSAPVSARQLLISKFVVSYLPALVLGSLFLFGSSILQGTAILLVLHSFLILAMCLAGTAGLLVALGGAGANLTWDDPRKMNAGALGCVGSILAMLFIPVNLALFIAPLVIADLLHLPKLYGYLIGSALGIGMSMVVALISMRLAEAKVERLGE